MSTIIGTATVQSAQQTVPAPGPGTKAKLTHSGPGGTSSAVVVEVLGAPQEFTLTPGLNTITCQQLAKDNATPWGQLFTWSEEIAADVTVLVVTGVSVEVKRV